MLNKKDTYRSFGIWIVLILFYAGFYFISNYAWVTEIDLQAPDEITTSDVSPVTLSPAKLQVKKSPETTLYNDAADPTKEKIQNNKSKQSNPGPIQKTYPKKKISINTANKEDWESLYNIGPYRAERIINFRSSLGGFYSVDQVGETYAVPDSVFRQIKPQLYIGSEPIIKAINVNTLIYDSLYLHPYITKQMAYFIVKHRQDQPIENMDDLYVLIKEKDHERLRKLEPYLDFGIR